MGKRSRSRAVLVAAILLIFSGAGVVAFAADAWASGTLSVSPSTDLTDGQGVTVSGSGFTASSTGGVIECNNDPGQPTISFLGNAVPVSCTSPLAALKSTDSSGNLAAFTFTVVTGTVGPPTTSGTDSAGNPPATDAALYPCPPTPAQVTAGDSCVVAFGDEAGDKATQNISFSSSTGTTTTTTTTTSSTTTTTKPPASTTTTTKPTGTTTTTKPTGTTTTTKPTGSTTTTTTKAVTAASSASTSGTTTTTVATSASSLAFTGAGPGVWVLLVAGFVLIDLGFLVVTIYYRPRELFAMAGRRIHRVFRGDG
jgi:hypothetical protein